MEPQITTNGYEQRIPHKQEKDLPGNANWVVQKYGGTSLGKFPREIAEDIVVYECLKYSCIGQSLMYCQAWSQEASHRRRLLCTQQLYQERGYHEPVSHTYPKAWTNRSRAC